MDLDKLVNLARIKISEEEKASFTHEFEAILAYVGQIQNAPGLDAAPTHSHRNIFRADSNPNIPGQYSEDLLNSAPERGEGDSKNFFKVKNIL